MAWKRNLVQQAKEEIGEDLERISKKEMGQCAGGDWGEARSEEWEGSL